MTFVKFNTLSVIRWSLLIVFSAVFCSISLVNHYNFRTYIDLAFFTNIAYQYSHFSWSRATVLASDYFQFDNSLGDHFHLHQFFLWPLRYVFETYTMLVVQIAFVIIGGLGVEKVVRHFTGNKLWGVLSLFCFFTHWSIYSALAFDYHENVNGAMLMPWFIYYFLKKEYKVATLFFILILAARENMGLWLFFVSIGLYIHTQSDKFRNQIKQDRIYLISTAAVSLVYFYVVVSFVLPSFASKTDDYIHFQFSSLGDNIGEAILTVINKPQLVFTLLFESPFYDQPWTFGIKSEFHFVVLVSGGFALFARPQFLIMLIPIYAQKLFIDKIVSWGVNYHYSIEFAPIVIIALFYFLHTLKVSDKYRIVLLSICVILPTLITIRLMDYKVSVWDNKVYVKFYDKRHYQTPYDIKAIYEGLKNIPKDANVCAQNMLTPHLALREKIYLFPYIFDADYIALVPSSPSPWPLKNFEDYHEKHNELYKSGVWEYLINSKDFILMKKISK